MGTILILNHLIFNDFDFKSSVISIILILMQARIQGGGGIWGTCPPLEPNAQRKNLRRLKDLRGQIQQKSPKFSK